MARPNTILRATCFAIGALLEQTGVNIETIRYYEPIGLLTKPGRTAGGLVVSANTSFSNEPANFQSFAPRSRSD